MLPDVLLIAEVNVLPAVGKTRPSCAAKVREAPGPGREKPECRRGAGSVKVPALWPLLRAAPLLGEGRQVSDRCPLMSFLCVRFLAPGAGRGGQAGGAVGDDGR